MNTKILFLSTLVMAIALGCVNTIDYQAPQQVNQNSSFQSIVYTEAVDSLPLPGYTITGLLEVLVPEGWSVDSVFLDGYSFYGLMSSGSSGWAAEEYPPGIGYKWVSFYASELTGDYGDTGQATVYITSGDSAGVYTTAAIGVIIVVEPWVAYLREGDPCSCSVEINPLNLEQETWGSIKLELGE